MKSGERKAVAIYGKTISNRTRRIHHRRLSNAMFRVELENDTQINIFLEKCVCISSYYLMKVKLEMSPYDLSKQELLIDIGIFKMKLELSKKKRSPECKIVRRKGRLCNKQKRTRFKQRQGNYGKNSKSIPKRELYCTSPISSD
jgi:ribosomal protein L36